MPASRSDEWHCRKLFEGSFPEVYTSCVPPPSLVHWGKLRCTSVLSGFVSDGTCSQGEPKTQLESSQVLQLRENKKTTFLTRRSCLERVFWRVTFKYYLSVLRRDSKESIKWRPPMWCWKYPKRKRHKDKKLNFFSISPIHFALAVFFDRFCLCRLNSLLQDSSI